MEAGDKPSSLQASLTKGGPGEPGARGGFHRTSFLHSVKMVHGGARMRSVSKAYNLLHRPVGEKELTSPKNFYLEYLYFDGVLWVSTVDLVDQLFQPASKCFIEKQQPYKPNAVVVEIVDPSRTRLGMISIF